MNIKGLFLFLCYQPLILNAQLNWNTGGNLHLDFSDPNNISVSKKGQIPVFNETSVTVDEGGKILFYTDGVNVWNGNNELMTNGQDLGGHRSTSQAVAVVQFPNDNNRYYLFTLESAEGDLSSGESNGNLYYSILDMNQENGLGDVVIKKKLLYGSLTEGMISVKGFCQNAYLICHERDNNRYVVFNIDEEGVSLPIISAVGSIANSGYRDNTRSTWVGKLIASNKGDYLVHASKSGIVELLKFNLRSGTVDSAIRIQSAALSADYLGSYSARFSPNDKYLYLTEYSALSRTIAQYDLSSLDEQDIFNSRQEITRQPFAPISLMDIQADPFGRLLISGLDSTHLTLIRNPNAEATEIDFTLKYLKVVDVVIKFLGLHEYPILFDQSDLLDSNIILTDSMNFCNASQKVISSANTYIDYLWNTGETVKEIIPRDEGWFSLDVVTEQGCKLHDSIFVMITSLDFSLGENLNICRPELITLSSNVVADNFVWSTGETSAEIKVSNTGDYWLEAEIDGCTYRDTISVNITSYDLDLGDDITQCDQSILTSLPSNIASDSYLWSTGETIAQIEVSQSGTYWLETSIDNCIQRDTIKVTYDEDGLSISAMIQNCVEQIYGLSSNIVAEQYLWSTDEITREIIVGETDSYWLEIQNGSCRYRDSIELVLDNIDVDIPNDTTICDGDVLSISMPSPPLTLAWEDGYIGFARQLSESGSYGYTISTGVCDISSTIDLGVEECELPICNVYVPNAISSNAISSENRNLRIYSNCEISSFQLEVYDRWGNLLHKGTDPELPWDQVFLDKPLTIGVYMLKISYRLSPTDDEVEVYKTLSLL